MTEAGPTGADGVDPLRDLSLRLAALDHEPVAQHPDALELVHRGIVAELDALAATATPPRPGRG